MKWRNLDQCVEALVHEYRDKGPYEVLGVRPLASSDEIKRAYLKMIRVYHPDRASDFMRTVNEEITKIINNAYDSILRDRNEPR